MSEREEKLDPGFLGEKMYPQGTPAEPERCPTCNSQGKSGRQLCRDAWHGQPAHYDATIQPHTYLLDSGSAIVLRMRFQQKEAGQWFKRLLEDVEQAITATGGYPTELRLPVTPLGLIDTSLTEQLQKVIEERDQLQQELEIRDEIEKKAGRLAKCAAVVLLEDRKVRNEHPALAKFLDDAPRLGEALLDLSRAVSYFSKVSSEGVREDFEGWTPTETYLQRAERDLKEVREWLANADEEAPLFNAVNALADTVTNLVQLERAR